MSITPSTPENVYRFPYEFPSAVSYSAAAFAMAMLPVPNAVNFIVLPSMGTLAVYRYMQGRRIQRYRKNLRNLPYFAMRPQDIPVSTKAQFVGRGFKWTQTHTQRLMMARMKQNEHLVEPGRLYKWARHHEILSNGASPIARFTSKTAWWNPVAPLPPVGGKPELHGVEPKEENVWLDLAERGGHTLVEGTTGVGKTRFAEILVEQDIIRGDVVITIDPKGDADFMLMHYVAAKKAGRPFYLFHLGYPWLSCRYNPVGQFTRVTEVATRVANQLPGEGQSATFKQFVWRFVNVLTKLMEALSIKPSYNNIYDYAINIENLASQYFEKVLNDNNPNWHSIYNDYELDKSEKEQSRKTGRSEDVIRLMSYVKKMGLKDSLFDAVSGILNNDRTYFDKLVSSLYPLLEKLTSGDIAKLISPEFDDLTDPRPILDWQKVINENAVVYVGLDSLTDQQVATAVGNAMFADLTSLSGQIYKFGVSYGQSDKAEKRWIDLHADEFNELVGDEFIPMLNKARGAGFRCTAYTQTVADIEAKIGSTAKAQQMLGNFNNLFLFRVKSIETAELLTNQLPDVRVVTGTLASGAGDVAFPDEYEDFTSRNEDRLSTETVPTLTTADLINLPKGQAFALINGGNLYKLRMPLPLPDPDVEIPSNLLELADKMRETVHLSQAADNNESQSAFTEGKHYA
ncbi:MAG: type IV conjugative transfer system coupling protein TraD [Neisseria sp.]